uniref:Uncharacterized protein n=1 Tax=Oryza glumipatula TaxID=40148 RepID=A0A0E0A3A8_9ORYZ
MAPRGYLAEVALLTSASEDLAAVGPGEREGWLDDPAVLPPLAPRARALAVAVAARSVLAVAPVAGGGGRVTVRPALGPDDGRISAVEWIPLAGEDAGEAGERVAVAVGTDARIQWLLEFVIFFSKPDDELMSVLHNLPDINITCKARQVFIEKLNAYFAKAIYYRKGLRVPRKSYLSIYIYRIECTISPKGRLGILAIIILNHRDNEYDQQLLQLAIFTEMEILQAIILAIEFRDLYFPFYI